MEENQNKRDAKEAEAGEEQKKLPYPKQVFFIIGNEFCERFSYYGMKAVLSIYLKSKLHFSEDTATVIYHTFSGLCYTTPIFGAMLADQFFGKFKTIFWISLIYVLGHILKTLAAIPPIGLDPVSFSLIGLLLIAIGTGGIKPCVSAFGGDQFKLPEQERQLQTFFSIFYFSINAGSLISTFITPIFRQDIHCFGDDTCYSLAFGVPAILMVVATVILVMGKNLYVHKAPQGSILTQVIGSIFTALKRRKNSEPVDHWLDRAKGTYSDQLVEDTKIFLKVLVLFTPLPIYWALFDQQGSRWTFQAQRMNGQVGNWIIKPDQMQLINPAFILILIPLFDQIIYPLFAKFNLLKKPLQRMVVGGSLTAAAFFISGILELELAKTYAVIPSEGESHAHVMNLLPCDLSIGISNLDGSYSNSIDITAKMNSIVYDLKKGQYDFEVKTSESCPENLRSKITKLKFVAQSKVVSGFIVRTLDEKLNIMEIKEAEEPKKLDDGDPRFKVVFNAENSGNEPHQIVLRHEGVIPNSEDDTSLVVALTNSSYDGVSVTPYGKIDPGSYDVYYNDKKISNIILPQGGVHTFVVDEVSAQEPKFLDFLLTSENSIHLFWIVPQYFVITVGEIMFSITALEFSYSQAPTSMKSVLQAVNLLTVAFGNLIVIIVAEAKMLDQASEFLMFGCLMLIDMALLAYLAYNYTYVKIVDKSDQVSNNNANLEDIPLEDKPSAMKSD